MTEEYQPRDLEICENFDFLLELRENFCERRRADEFQEKKREKERILKRKLVNTLGNERKRGKNERKNERRMRESKIQEISK